MIILDIGKLRADLVDEMYNVLERAGSVDETANWFEEHIERPVLDLICKYEGHYVEDDHCMIPEHRFCLICSRRIGNVPLGQQQPETNETTA